MSNTFSIVRTENAGVFLAEISEFNTETRMALLNDSRRLWYWEGAATLSQLATDGVSKPENCKFPAAIESHMVMQVIEIIPATEKAVKSIAEVPVWEV